MSGVQGLIRRRSKHEVRNELIPLKNRGCFVVWRVIQFLRLKWRLITMMGPKQIAQSALFYEFSIEDHVPPDHLLRAMDRFIDLSDPVPDHSTFSKNRHGPFRPRFPMDGGAQRACVFCQFRQLHDRHGSCGDPGCRGKPLCPARSGKWLGCCSPISNAPSARGASDCEDHAAPGTSTTSQPPPGTSERSQSSSGHHKTSARRKRSRPRPIPHRPISRRSPDFFNGISPKRTWLDILK